jgi:hypothetical protein
MHRQVVKKNNFSNITGDININNFNISGSSKWKKYEKIIFILLDNITFLKKELFVCNKRKSKLSSRAHDQKNYILEKDAEIKYLRNELGKY